MVCPSTARNANALPVEKQPCFTVTKFVHPVGEQSRLTSGRPPCAGAPAAKAGRGRGGRGGRQATLGEAFARGAAASTQPSEGAAGEDDDGGGAGGWPRPQMFSDPESTLTSTKQP